MRGGDGDDRLRCGARRDRLEGDAGSDVVEGRGGDDELFSSENQPPRAERRARDRLSGGRGDDYLLGGPGTDTLEGGPGRDLMAGRGGIDRLLARDRRADAVYCGDWFDGLPRPGRDLARLDRRDTQTACGRVERTGPQVPELLGVDEPRRARRGGRTVLRAYVGCPRRRARACRARLRVNPASGPTQRCTLRVTAGARRRVRFVIATVRGDFGARVTLVGRRHRRTLDVDKPLEGPRPADGGTIRALTVPCTAVAAAA